MTFIATLVGSVLATMASDVIMGACIVYDLVALTAGQTGTWQQVLAASAGICGLLTLYKAFNSPGLVETVKESKDN